MEPFSHTLFFVACNSLDPAAAHSSHLEQAWYVLAVLPIELQSAVVAPVRQRMLSIVEVTARIAQLSSHEPCLHSPSWEKATGHTVFPSLVVNDISRPELRERQEPWSLDDVLAITHRNNGSDRQAGEIVARQKPLACKVTIRVEVRLC
jgi:hypothetical protein